MQGCYGIRISTFKECSRLFKFLKNINGASCLKKSIISPTQVLIYALFFKIFFNILNHVLFFYFFFIFFYFFGGGGCRKFTDSFERIGAWIKDLIVCLQRLFKALFYE